MNKFFISLTFSVFILASCAKEDDNEVSYPAELVPYTELKDMKLYVGGTEQSSTGLKPESIFEKSDLGKDFYYVKLKSSSELTLTFDGNGGDSYELPYSFKNDSMLIISDQLEEGRIFLGKGSRTSLKKECGAFMFYGYRMKNGQKEDVNYDEIINDQDKVRITVMRDKFLTSNDVLTEMGYSTMSQLTSHDSIVVYNYTLRFVKDKDGDRIYTSADK